VLKRIPTADLRVGMYVDEFCGSWMDHPFWRARFVVKTTAELAQIRDSDVREVWIDASKGLDTERPAAAATDRRAADTLVDLIEDHQRRRSVVASRQGRLQGQGETG